MRTLDDFRSAVVFARDHMNPYLFNYAFSVAMLHRRDTRHMQIPTLFEVFPDKFMDGDTFPRAKEEVTIVDNDEARVRFNMKYKNCYGQIPRVTVVM